MTDPAKIIAIMRVMLTELERSLSEAPQEIQEDDASSDRLKAQIARLDAVLKKRQSATRRKQELDRENERNKTAETR